MSKKMDAIVEKLVFDYMSAPEVSYDWMVYSAGEDVEAFTHDELLKAMDKKLQELRTALTN